MVMIKGLLILILLVLVAIVDYQAVAAGEPLPSAWFQIGVLAFLIGIEVTGALIDRLKRTTQMLEGSPRDPTPARKNVVMPLLLVAATLFAAVYGASLYAAAFGLLLGCLSRATWRIREINAYNGRMRALRAAAIAPTTSFSGRTDRSPEGRN